MYEVSTGSRSSRSVRGRRRPRRLLPRVLAVTAAGAVAMAGLAWMSIAPASAATTAGATTPFTSYEGEAGGLAGGTTRVSAPASPTTKYSSAALEASGHSYVHLGATGQSVQWTNNTGKPISYINVRASIPDSASGGGITGTLDLYVNGVFRQALNLNSKQTWIYEGTSYNSSNDQNPAHGDPRVFWDESRAFVTGTPIAAGGTLMLKKDSANTASYYNIDVIDVENPPAPIAQPANSISITSCGAVSDNTQPNGSADSKSVDSRAAIQNCINQAQSQKKVLWIPQGTFYVKGTAGLTANGITIAGAGMWYSNVYRSVSLPNSTPLGALFSVTSCTVQNFHIDANAPSRDTILGGDGGALDTTGTNWVTTGMWAQHTESGIWASGTGGKVQNSRFTDTWADGINLNNQSLSGGKAQVGNNLTATNNFIRGAGDDSMAINSTAYQVSGSGVRTNFSPMTNTTFSHNTAIAPWGGKGVGAYGGGGQVVTANYISDTSRFLGLVVGRFGVNGSDVTSASVTNNVIVRSGGNAYGQLQPAVHIGNASDGQQTGTVNKVTLTGNTISNALYDAVAFSTSTNSLLQNNTITSPGRNGIEVAPPNYPAPSGSATITGNTLTGLKSGFSAFLTHSSAFKATVTNNSWQ
jgi:parallel beta-helix repeat protein